ncbi:hypothetical protein ATCVGM07011_614L [Acanthocystis turfacea Chlorella virus GM0701.1]|nr:hypothetical protein ATCVGM07011_614L [Acanthocystis turfacea Chlorella virus GM0701.1]
MPHVSRSHRYSSAFVNVRVRTSDDYGEECPVCMRTWCQEDACNRTCVQTSCCLQFFCASCVTKISQKCNCESDCKNVVFICPFCRSISKTETVALFVGNKRVCKKCKNSDKPIEPSPAADTTDTACDDNDDDNDDNGDTED